MSEQGPFVNVRAARVSVEAVNEMIDYVKLATTEGERAHELGKRIARLIDANPMRNGEAIGALIATVLSIIQQWPAVNREEMTNVIAAMLVKLAADRTERGKFSQN